MARRFDGLWERPAATVVTVNGTAVAAIPGESLATALVVAGIKSLRPSPVLGQARGPFCFMGVCQECMVRVDGRRVQACLETVRPGMFVETAAVDRP